MMAEQSAYPIVIMNDISVKRCQYSNSPMKSIQVKITPKAAYMEFINKLALTSTSLLNSVKQLAQKVINSKLTSMVKKEMNNSNISENSDSFRYVELMRTKPNIVISPRVVYYVFKVVNCDER